MELHEYPRPLDDTGIGIHWSPSYATTVGLNQIRDFWLPEMKALGVKWVKIFNHDGALDFAELLLAEGIMPIVRLYQPTPNPSQFGVSEIVHLEAYIRSGVRYFEFNHEPDVDTSWKGGRLPANAIDLVVENCIANLEMILERGGMPAIPALSSGCDWDLVGKIVAAGHKDLLDGPVWQAVHNYAHNRPLDYPNDSGNQEGAPYSQRFYDALLHEQWGEDAWQGRTLEIINRLRFEQHKPGAAIQADHACWLAYERYNSRHQRHLGRNIPILSTECGYLVGEASDPRYPATTPHLHMAQTLESCRIMMGTSQRFTPAPDYYFCTAFWLLANDRLGSKSNWWEGHAWYSDRWAGGSLPLVQALHDEPKSARLWQNGAPVGGLAIVRGTVAHATAETEVVLFQHHEEIARTPLDSNSCYTFTALTPGPYTIQLAESELTQETHLEPGQGQVILNFDLGELEHEDPATSQSSLLGRVGGGAGATVVLIRTGSGREWLTVAKPDGSFGFEHLAAGDYSIRLESHGNRVEKFRLDGQNQQHVRLIKTGWGYTVREQSSEPEIDNSETDNSKADNTEGDTVEGDNTGSALYCHIPDQPHATVQAKQGGWQSPVVTLENEENLEQPTAMLTGLAAGRYTLVVEGVADDRGNPVPLEASINLGEDQTLLVDFVHHTLWDEVAPEDSHISGRVIGPLDQQQESPLRLLLVDSQGKEQEKELRADRSFEFTALAAGLYTLQLTGSGALTSQTQVALDGTNQVKVELMLPTDNVLDVNEGYSEELGHSLIMGVAPGAAGKIAKLMDSVGNETQQVVDAEERFRFAFLAAGTYDLTIPEYEQGIYQEEGIYVDGHSGWELFMTRPESTWAVQISEAGSMPGFSAIRAEVQGQQAHPVHVWQEEQEGSTKPTGDADSESPYSVEFSPLEAGRYMVEAVGLDVWTEVTLTGLEAVWVNFYQKREQIQPNVVRPLTAQELASATSVHEGDVHAPNNMFSALPIQKERHYLFIEDTLDLTEFFADRETFLDLLRYVARHQPEIGSSILDASKADQVRFLGGEERGDTISR